MARDFYAILALPRNATDQQIRRRFRELVRDRHPDHFRGQEKARAETEFQAITEAYNVLSDPERRRRHDLELSRPTGGSSTREQSARVYLQRGIQAYRDRNLVSAADYLEKATQGDPGNPQAWYHLALVSGENPRWTQKAAAAAVRACELDPLEPEYAKLAGQLLARSDQVGRAIVYLERAASRSEGDPEIESMLSDLRRGSRRRRGLFGKSVEE